MPEGTLQRRPVLFVPRNNSPRNISWPVAVNNRNAFINQTVSERDVFGRNVVAPIAAPVNGSDNQIARSLMRAHLIGHPRGGGF